MNFEPSGCVVYFFKYVNAVRGMEIDTVLEYIIHFTINQTIYSFQDEVNIIIIYSI